MELAINLYNSELKTEGIGGCRYRNRRRLGIGASFEVRREAGCDRRVVHDIVKRLRFGRHHPELPRLRLREAAGGKSSTRRFRFRI